MDFRFLDQDEYDRILNVLTSNTVSLEQINRLKQYFKEDINSQRTFERILSLSDLVDILERRDCVGPDNPQALVHIVEKVAPNNLQIRQILVARGFIEEQNVAFGNPVMPPVENRPPIQRVLPPEPSNVTDRIHSMIINHIGTKWKELARGLDISEGRIDDLVFRYDRNRSRMIAEVLQNHYEIHGRTFDRWRTLLQRALEDARRRDLSVQIDEIVNNGHARS